MAKMKKARSIHRPMATYNKGSRKYKEIRKQVWSNRLTKLKEFVFVMLFVLFLSIDWDRTLDALMGIS